MVVLVRSSSHYIVTSLENILNIYLLIKQYKYVVLSFFFNSMSIFLTFYNYNHYVKKLELYMEIYVFR